MYADQTGLMCYFGLNRTKTMPCHFLMDVANPLLVPGARKWFLNCFGMLRQHMQKQCFRGSPKKACLPPGGAATTCHAVLNHLRGNCVWRRVSSEVRAVHFKGKVKPWPFAPTHANNMCRAVMHGSLRMRDGGGSTKVASTIDDLEWNATASSEPSAGACVSVSIGARVYWGGSGVSLKEALALPKKCCHYHTLISAEWNRLLTAPRMLNVFST